MHILFCFLFKHLIVFLHIFVSSRTFLDFFLTNPKHTHTQKIKDQYYNTERNNNNNTSNKRQRKRMGARKKMPTKIELNIIYIFGFSENIFFLPRVPGLCR